MPLVGIVGGGQLGRMTALAGRRLGVSCRFLDPSLEACAGEVGALEVGGFDDRAALDRFAAGLDAATCEFENVPAASLARLAERVPVRPGPASFAAAQDRLEERRLLASCGVPTAPHRVVDSIEDLWEAWAALGGPIVLKARRHGYDGKGQAFVRTPDGIEAAWSAVGGRPSVAEALVRFTREASIVGVRDASGAAAFYPLVESVHRDGVLHLTRTLPEAPRWGEAATHARRVMEALDHVGVLALELFDTGEGLIANEVAPRVHNTGHWTIEGAETSQFENHLRAVLGWPLGATGALGPSAMVNLIGTAPPIERLLAVGGATVHLYGKAARPGRKVGHVTVRGPDMLALEDRLRRVESIIGGGPAA